MLVWALSSLCTTVPKRKGRFYNLLFLNCFPLGDVIKLSLITYKQFTPKDAG